MALLRCVGARRLDLFGSQILGGLIFGVLGAATGVPLGIGLTAALVAYFAEYVPTGLAIDRFGVDSQPGDGISCPGRECPWRECPSRRCPWRGCR